MKLELLTDFHLDYLVPGDYDTVNTPLPPIPSKIGRENLKDFRCRANRITYDDYAPFYIKRQVHRAWVILYKYPSKRYLARLIVERAEELLDEIEARWEE